MSPHAANLPDLKGSCRVAGWRPIRDKAMPIMSFGEDEMGEVYLMTYAASGRGIYRFVRSDERK